MMLAAAAPPAFSAWENFYVIVGSSAGALAGLQFVVMTLIAEGRVKGGMHEVSAFGTPTIVHFCIALLIAAIASCPWQSLTGPVVALAGCGVAGALYILNAMRHARRVMHYKLDLEDWIWYACVPLAVYLFLFAAAILLTRDSMLASFSIAAVSLALLLLGIRNAWDTVTFVAVQHAGKADAGGAGAEAGATTENGPSQPAQSAK
ncbi:MAG: hypothetical protein WA824_12695 [Candidatus Sulfotelmatobacter sp.]